MFPLPSGWHSSILILTFFQRWSHTSSSFNMVQVHSLSVVFILSVAAPITPVIVALPLQAHHQEPTIDPRLWVVYVQWSSVCHILNPVHRLTGHPSLVPHSTNPRRVPLLNPYPLDRPIYPGPQQASTQDHHPHSDSDHQSQSGSQAHTPSPSPGPHPGSPGSQNHVPHTDLPGSQAHTPSPSPSPHPGSPGSQNHVPHIDLPGSQAHVPHTDSGLQAHVPHTDSQAKVPLSDSGPQAHVPHTDSGSQPPSHPVATSISNSWVYDFKLWYVSQLKHRLDLRNHPSTSTPQSQLESWVYVHWQWSITEIKISRLANLILNGCFMTDRTLKVD